MISWNRREKSFDLILYHHNLLVHKAGRSPFDRSAYEDTVRYVFDLNESLSPAGSLDIALLTEKFFDRCNWNYLNTQHN